MCAAQTDRGSSLPLSCARAGKRSKTNNADVNKYVNPAPCSGTHRTRARYVLHTHRQLSCCCCYRPVDDDDDDGVMRARVRHHAAPHPRAPTHPPGTTAHGGNSRRPTAGLLTHVRSIRVFWKYFAVKQQNKRGATTRPSIDERPRNVRAGGFPGKNTFERFGVLCVLPSSES